MKSSLRAPVLVALIPVVTLACTRRESTSQQPPPLVRVHTLVSSAEAPLELRASLAAAHRARLGFRQGGVIAAIEATEGDRVQRGQVLARLVDTDARAAVRAALAAQGKAERDKSRAERLATQGAIPTSVRDDARSQFEAADARLDEAREALQRTSLVAPLEGTVFARLAEPGESIGAGSPVIVIDSSGRLRARAGATESERQRLRSGQPASIALDDGESLGGRVTSVAEAPNPEDGLYAVEVTPDAQRPDRLLPGMLVRLRFTGAPAGQVVRIPLEALVYRNDQDQVFVVESTGQALRARMRPVAIDRSAGPTVIVRQGLKAGERVISEGAYFLQDGQTVRVAE